MGYGRKITGGKYHKFRKKRKHSLSGVEGKVKLRETKQKTVRTRGGNKKTSLLVAKFVNIREKNKTKKLEIKNIIETPSNRFLARQNVITKGAIVDTELGKVKITNRPGQEGNVNGILIEK